MKTNAVEVALHRTLRELRSRLDSTDADAERAGLEWVARPLP